MFKRTAVPPVGSSERQARQPLNMALALSMRLSLVISVAFCTASSVALANGRPSTCVGSSGSGSLINGMSLPLAGENFASYSALGWSAGRTYVHSAVYLSLVEAYRALEMTAPDKTFVYGESGWSNGGKFPPHKTHQNGTSVDFMVPVLLGKASVPLPTSLTNGFGYEIEFDAQGSWERYKIDFEAISEHLYQLDLASRKHGIGITRVIFEVPLQKKLWNTKHWAYLKKHVKFSVKRAWVSHDEHYHVDFAVRCQAG